MNRATSQGRWGSPVLLHRRLVRPMSKRLAAGLQSIGCHGYNAGHEATMALVAGAGYPGHHRRRVRCTRLSSRCVRTAIKTKHVPLKPLNGVAQHHKRQRAGQRQMITSGGEGVKEKAGRNGPCIPRARRGSCWAKGWGSRRSGTGTSSAACGVACRAKGSTWPRLGANVALCWPAVLVILRQTVSAGRRSLHEYSPRGQLGRPIVNELALEQGGRPVLNRHLSWDVSDAKAGQG
jgi:hypothetical protein